MSTLGNHPKELVMRFVSSFLDLHGQVMQALFQRNDRPETRDMTSITVGSKVRRPLVCRDDPAAWTFDGHGSSKVLERAAQRCVAECSLVGQVCDGFVKEALEVDGFVYGAWSGRVFGDAKQPNVTVWGSTVTTEIPSANQPM